MTQNRTDAELVNSLAHARDLDESLRFLYRAHFHVLASYVMQNKGDWADAEDVFQEVMVSFVSLVQAGRFRGESSIRTFLYALNRNIWLNELKRRGRALEREKKYRHMEGEERAIPVQLEDREATGQLLEAVGALGENCKKILLLYYFENRSMKEILSALDYENEQVVRNKKYKCLKKLESMLLANKKLFTQLKSLFHD